MAFSTAITGLKAATTELDVTGNNIANASTVGFKSGRTEFADIFSTVVVGSGSANSPGSGVIVSDIAQDFTAGTIQFTNNNLDLAIDGSGFFQLSNGQGGTTYTRAGGFELDKDGFVVSKTGNFLQGFGLDALGNMQPVGNMQVDEKESPPKATEIMDLSFNIDSREVASNIAYDSADSSTYTFSTTNRTFDSLGNENTIKFDFIKQGAWRERQTVSFANAAPFPTVGGEIINVAGGSFTAAAGIDETNIASAIVAQFTAGTLGVNLDNNIASMSVDTSAPPQLIVTYKASASDVRPIEIDVAGSSAPVTGVSEDPFFPANKVEAFGFPTVTPPFIAGDTIDIGGVPIGITGATTSQDIVDAIIKDSNKILAQNPDIDTITKNTAGTELIITYKPELGDTPTTAIVPNVAVLGSLVVGAAVTTPSETGDSSYAGVYQVHALFNNVTPLDIGLGPNPGSGLTSTEPGPILIKYDTSNGLLQSINGVPVSAVGTAPPISIIGADPAKPLDDILMDFSGSTQYASDSIVKASTQDGYTKGDLIGITFAPNGTMVASFSNGQNSHLGRVALATFENQSGLQPVGNTSWSATLASGQAILNPPSTGLNGSLRSAALEQSNVDLSEQLVKLIEAQRNFQANSKTLQTENAITQSILQIQ